MLTANFANESQLLEAFISEIFHIGAIRGPTVWPLLAHIPQFVDLEFHELKPIARSSH